MGLADDRKLRVRVAERCPHGADVALEFFGRVYALETSEQVLLNPFRFPQRQRA